MKSSHNARQNSAFTATLKYGAVNGAFWMLVSIIIGSFAPILLKSKQFSYSEIGIILSLSGVISILVQPFLASLADNMKQLSFKLFTFLVLLVIFFSSILLLLTPANPITTALLYIITATMIQSLPPILNSIAMEYVENDIPINYGLSRGAGSLSYGVIAYILGMGTVRFGAEIILPVFIGLLILTMVTVLLLDTPGKHKNTDMKALKKQDKSQNRPNIFEFFRTYPKFSFFLIGVTFTFIGHASINTYLTNVINYVGGNDASLGTAVILAAIFELAAMCTFALVVKKIKVPKLLMISFFCFFIKTFLMLIASNLIVIMAAQAFQMLAYGTFAPASVYYVNSIMGKQDKTRGQALLGVATMGLGSSLANFISGRLIDTAGLKSMLLFSVIVSFIGFIVVLFSIEEPKKL